ncbi:MAG: TerB family tellurite resistance protein [Planctomycetota bacterium]|nr:MAG: TerB family tellurite resistance protein [Planctomycetota bacterium]
MSTPDPLDLHAPGWLHRLLDAYFETYDPARAREAVAAVLATHPSEPPAEQSLRLALRRLEHMGLRPWASTLPAPLAKRLGLNELARDEQELLGLLVARLDIVQDIAWLHREQREAARGPLEVLAIVALGLKDYGLARKLHAAQERALRGESVPLGKLARKVEARLARRERSRERRGSALTIGLGLAYIEARVLARIASLYYERAAIEEEGVERLHALSAGEKSELIEVLLHLAWADGEVSAEERALIERQLQLAELERSVATRLRKRLNTPPGSEPLADLLPIRDAATRRFLLEQAVLLTLVDDAQDTAELDALERVAERLGCGEGELEEILVEVTAWYERNRELLQGFGPVAGSLGRLRRLVVDRAADAVRSNMRKIVQEIRETGELAKLLGVASVRELTPEEARKVKSQLLDVCKTVPALAIFLLPGGGLLLPVLIKLLPFNLLPTAFGEGPAEVERVAPPEPEG